MTRLVGVELTPTELRVARVERRFGTTRLVSCGRIPCATAAERRAALAPVLAWRPHQVVAALPLGALAHRILTLPFRDARRIAETVTLELAGQLPSDPGDVATGHLLVATAPDGTRVLAALARRARIDAVAAALAEAGVEPERIDAALVGVSHLVAAADASDAAFLVADGERSAITVRRNGRLAGLRALAADPARDADGFAREVRWTLAALGGATSLVVAGVDASDELRARVARAVGSPAVRLADVATPAWRAGELGACAVAAGLVAGPGLVLHRAGQPARSGRRVGALAAAAALLAVVDVGVVRWHLARLDAALVEAVRTTAAAALPPGTRLVAPRAQLEAAAGSLARRAPTAGSVLALLRELSQRIPADVRLELDELTLDGDVVRLHGRTDRFESIDVVARALGTSAGLREVATEDSRAAVDGRGVEFGLRATWHAPAGAPS